MPSTAERILTMFEERGFKSPSDDPEPKPKNPDNPTVLELRAHMKWVQRHSQALKPFFRVCEPEPYED
jgi:hypothetical protein